MEHDSASPVAPRSNRNHSDGTGNLMALGMGGWNSVYRTWCALPDLGLGNFPVVGIRGY